MPDLKDENGYKNSRILEISFPGGKIVDGKIKAEPGFYIELNPKGGGVIKRRAGGGPGITIEPCECALETGGSCAQATTSDANGNITDLWCVDQGCGFCVGGLTPEVGAVFSLKIRFATVE
jgi:hypothetical protein